MNSFGPNIIAIGPGGGHAEASILSGIMGFLRPSATLTSRLNKNITGYSFLYAVDCLT
jgi:hypothetical protein